MADFPLLDRGQPILEKDQCSTITTDTLLAIAAIRMGEDPEPWEARAKRARDIGAKAYVPSEFAGIEATAEEKSAYA